MNKPFSWETQLPPKGWATQPDNLEPAELLALAMHILGCMDGLTVAQARRVLREADAWLDQSAHMDCSSIGFQQAAEELRRASGESA